jgi:hypothetical protein
MRRNLAHGHRVTNSPQPAQLQSHGNYCLHGLLDKILITIYYFPVTLLDLDDSQISKEKTIVLNEGNTDL